MRTFLKWLFALLFIGGIGWIVVKWYLNQDQISIESLSLIPPDAVYCITTDDPINTWKEIAGTRTWAHLKKNNYFAALTSSANNLDSLIRDNSLLFDMIGSHALMVSAHMISAKEYDFLFLVDLKGASGIKFLNEYITNFSSEDFTIKREKYDDYDIVTFYNPAEKTHLFVSMPGSYVLASYSKKIIMAALDTQKPESIQAAASFISTSTPLETGGLMQVHMNYTQLPKFMHSYSDASNDYVTRLSEALENTSLSVQVENDLISASGHTRVKDSIDSYLRSLAISGKAPTEIFELAPQRTAFCLGLGFKSFHDFFDNFQTNLRNDVTEYDAYIQNLKEVEDYLKISIHDNFVHWIGDEVAIFELQSSGPGGDQEIAVILKAFNIEDARKNLDYVQDMIRKRTPVKFKTVDHRGYAINYLSMKGLFKLLLGKFFARYDKPYYTIINNFVIFSNHPQTLESIIDDYLDKNTLDRSEEFREFRKKFDDEGSAFVYVNTPILFNTIKKLADPQTRADMETNKDYITCFRQIGFQLVPEEGGFKTLFAEQFVEPVQREIVTGDSLSTLLPAGIDSVESAVEQTTEPVAKDLDPMALPYIYVHDLNASSYKGYFSDSTVQYVVELKNGFKDGTYTEYHTNGEIKMKGHFENGKRDGTWRLFDGNGKLIMRRTYDKGEVTSEKLR
jgi:hypothetical protein